MNSITPIISLAETLSERSRRIHTTNVPERIYRKDWKSFTAAARDCWNSWKLSQTDSGLLLPSGTDLGSGLLRRLATALPFSPLSLHCTFRPHLPGRPDSDGTNLHQPAEECFRSLHPYADASVEISAQPVREGISLVVSDNGEGMLPEVTERIFVPFFTTKPSGSGIGLSLCKQIITLHNGRIQVQSQPGKAASLPLSYHKTTCLHELSSILSFPDQRQHHRKYAPLCLSAHARQSAPAML